MPRLKKKPKTTPENNITEDIISNTLSENTSNTNELSIYERCKDKVTILNEEDCIPTGITLLNLFLSNNRKGGFLKDNIVRISGAKSSGKTFTFLNFLATLAHNSNFDKYDLYYDASECGDKFDKIRLFGKKTVERIKELIVSDTNNENEFKTSLEGWFYKMHRLTEGNPFIHILDSLNALVSKVEHDNFNTNMENYEKGKDEKGEMLGLRRGQAHSLGFRDYCPKMENTGSLSIVVTQARTNTDSQFIKEKASESSYALEHWLSYDIMLKRTIPIKEKDFQGNDHIIGQEVEFTVNKSRGTGKMGKLPVPIQIYKEYGIDDLAVNVEYLKKYNIIKGSGWLTSPWNETEINEKTGRENIKKLTTKNLIKFIEDNNLEEEVSKKVEEIWLEAELSLYSGRKKKFGN